MTNLVMIDPIDAKHEGPNVPLPDSGDEYQLLHLRQGDIDEPADRTACSWRS